MILPSLLEYSKPELDSKLDLVLADLTKFKKLTKQPESILSFHLDFVLENFAKNRKVSPSLDLNILLELLELKFSQLNLDLSIHLMGNKTDLKASLKFLSQFELNPNFQARIFVPLEFVPEFEKITNTKKNLTTGVWLDLGEWNQQKIDQADLQDFLLMTVLAGKSGQKLTIETKQKSLEIAKNNKDKNFILDGGWSLQDVDKLSINNNFKQLQLVSYSSFWQAFTL